MKKLIFLCLSLLAAGIFFQACSNTKTYAEMLEEERDAVEQFLRDSTYRIISEEQFKANGYKTAVKGQNGATYDEFVSFTADGVYLQVVDPGQNDSEANKFQDGEQICVRYLEKNVTTRELTCWNVALDGHMDAGRLYANPGVFRYVNNTVSSYSAGTFIEMDYYWGSLYQSTAVPQGWLLTLPYLYDKAHVRLIVPSKMGHSYAQQNVTPFYYDIWEFSKAKS